MDDAAWMQRALELGERAAREEDEIPVGAVVVGPDAHAARDRSDLDHLLDQAAIPVRAALSLPLDPKALARIECSGREAKPAQGSLSTMGPLATIRRSTSRSVRMP